MEAITVDELKKLLMLEDLIFLDVREHYEVVENPFEGLDVLHIPMHEVSAHLNNLDIGKTVVVACVMGGRSAKVCEYLNIQGIEKVLNLTGGFLAWEQSRLSS